MKNYIRPWDEGRRNFKEGTGGETPRDHGLTSEDARGRGTCGAMRTGGLDMILGYTRLESRRTDLALGGREWKWAGGATQKRGLLWLDRNNRVHFFRKLDVPMVELSFGKPTIGLKFLFKRSSSPFVALITSNVASRGRANNA